MHHNQETLVETAASSVPIEWYTHIICIMYGGCILIHSHMYSSLLQHPWSPLTPLYIAK